MVKHTQTIRLARKGLSELEWIDLLLFPWNHQKTCLGGKFGEDPLIVASYSIRDSFSWPFLYLLGFCGDIR